MARARARQLLWRLVRGLVQVALCAGACGAAPGFAQPTTRSALLIQSDAPDATLREIGARLVGELQAAGFRVTQRPLAEPATPRLLAERAADALGVDAVILVRRSAPDSPNVDLWIADRVLGLTSNARLSVRAEQGEGTRRVAIEAAELLRARLAELPLREEAPALAPSLPTGPPEEAPSAADRAAGARPGRRLHVAAQAGVALLWRPRLWQLTPLPELGLALWWAPLRRAGWDPAWGVALRAAGYGRSVERVRDAGAASAEQGYGILSAFARGCGWGVLQPELMLGAGVYGLAVRGRAEPPYRAEHLRSFAPLVAGGLGLGVQLGPRITLRVAGELLGVLRKSALVIADRQVARTGGLMSVATLQLSGRLW